jgi:DNA invertase Pin-like site-specific DNA recombinase
MFTHSRIIFNSCSLKENFQLNGDDMQSKAMWTMLGLFAEIERDLIKMRVIEGVKAAQEKGVNFGKPKRGVGKSRLEQHKKVAARHEVSAPALWAWLKKQKG